MLAKRKASAKDSTDIRDIEAVIGKKHANTFRNVPHSHLRACYILTNPPFNDSDTALPDSAFLQREAKLQVMSEAKYNFPKDDDMRWHKGETDSNSKKSWR